MKRTMRMRCIAIMTVVAAVAALTLALSACQPQASGEEAADDAAETAQAADAAAEGAEDAVGEAAAETTQAVDTGDAVLDPTAWADQYPAEYQSWVDAGTAAYGIVIPEQRYEAHGKVNSLLDMYNMYGNNAPMGCYGCHSSAFPVQVETHDDLLADYTADIHSVLREAETMTVGISCYSCHGNTPGEPAVVKGWIADAAAEGNVEASDWNLVCAQCHATPDWGNINSSMDASTWSMLRYGVDPDAYWEVYQNLGGAYEPAAIPGESEFNQYLGTPMEQAGVDCYQCHMASDVDESGNAYTKHAFQSVATDESLLQNCADCHGDTTAERKAALEEVKAAYGEHLSTATAAKESLEAAVAAAEESGSADAEALDQARECLAKATWYLCYGTDRGNGIHSMDGSYVSSCLDTAQAAAEEGLALLG